MKCIGYNTNCIDAITQSNQMGTNTYCIETITFQCRAAALYGPSQANLCLRAFRHDKF